MVVAPGLLLIVENKLQEACASPCRTCAIHEPLSPAHSIRLAQRRDYSHVVCFSTTFLYRIWTGIARELNLEGLSNLFFCFFSFSLSGVLFQFVGAVYFRFFLENLKVSFPFSTDTVLNVA